VSDGFEVVVFALHRADAAFIDASLSGASLSPPAKRQSPQIQPSNSVGYFSDPLQAA
jgi:hypothetical protein